MGANNTIDQIELGRHLMQIRERAGLKQVELARKMTWSPAVLSRVENGERQLTDGELQTILDTIGSPESCGLKDVLDREWTVLPRPSLDHPDQELLWNAERIAQQLARLRDEPDVRSSFERRLSEYVAEIQQTAALLLKRDYQVAFIGSIGIGKTTAICRVSGLELPILEGETPTPVLEAGAGGITICEVHISTGPGYGLMIEPRNDDEVRGDVNDFTEHIMKGTDLVPSDPHDKDSDVQGISKEIERAIRNMSGLKVRREKAADGKTIRRDAAKELAERVATLREFAVETLARMELHKRDRRDVWYDGSMGKPPLTWLKDIFEAVNNGRHPEFTLPKRIEVVIPDAMLGATDFSVRIIDTKGIDRTATRADLERYFDEPHTLTVLCSGFNNAPAAEPRMLLERASKTGVRSLQTKAALLVLPRSDEALAVKDEAGVRVESAAEGYELKGEQVALALETLVSNLPVCFFNARHRDDAVGLYDFLTERVTNMRQTYRTRLDEITSNASKLLLNQEQEQVQEVIRHAATMLRTWATNNSNIGRFHGHIQESLMEQLASCYPSTIRASLRREGEWPNLSYSHHLGFGARRLAVLLLRAAVQGFSGVCKTMVGNPDFVEAKDLINQAERVLFAAFDDILRRAQLMGQASFRDELKPHAEFWSVCDNEWGHGQGYRDRVITHNRAWFQSVQGQNIENELFELVRREWTHALARMTALLEIER